MMDALVDPLARGRGRPRDEAKDVAIRHAAWAVLADKGYEALTFEAVADLAGCSRSTLYRRFTSKAELVETILNETSRAYEPALDPAASPSEGLLAHAMALREYMSDVRGPATLSISASAPSHSELQAALERHSNAEREYYFREFRRLKPEGVTPEALEFIFFTLVGSIIFHVAVRRAVLTDSQVAVLVEHAISMLCGEPAAGCDCNQTA